jgi:hypothetical protein
VPFCEAAAVRRWAHISRIGSLDSEAESPAAFPFDLAKALISYLRVFLEPLTHDFRPVTCCLVDPPHCPLPYRSPAGPITKLRV